MKLPPLIPVQLYRTRRLSGSVVAFLVGASGIDEVSSAAWIVGAGFIALEIYFFATLFRAWREDRRTRGD